jgi:hypothetical protein
LLRFAVACCSFCFRKIINRKGAKVQSEFGLKPLF